MKKLLLSTIIATNFTVLQASEDVYIDTDHTVYLHQIMCGDLKTANSIAQTGIFSNFDYIQKGKYSFTHPSIGEFSYMFEQQKSDNVDIKLMKRHIKRFNISTKKFIEYDDVCIIENAKSLSVRINDKIKTTILEIDAPDFNQKYKYLTSNFGVPVLKQGNFISEGLKSKEEVKAEKVKKAIQQVHALAEKTLATNNKNFIKTIKRSLKKAVKDANRKDGFMDRKKYTIKEPKKMNDSAKARYEKRLEKKAIIKQKDEEIQANYTWFLSKISKGAKLKTLKEKQTPNNWKEGILEKTVVLVATFSDGQTLDLNFDIKSNDLYKNARVVRFEYPKMNNKHFFEYFRKNNK